MKESQSERIIDYQFSHPHIILSFTEEYLKGYVGNYLYKNSDVRMEEMEQDPNKRNESLLSLLIIIVIIVFDLIFLFNIPDLTISGLKPVLYLIFGYIFVGFLFLSYLFYLSKKLDLPIKDVKRKLSLSTRILFIVWFISFFALLLLFIVSSYL